MDDPTPNQKRVAAVLERMAKMAAENPDDADMFVDELEGMLDEIADNDGFGTERQCDPRGDARNGQFSMSCVEGIDKGTYS